MRLKIVLPAKDAKKIKEKVIPLLASVESEDWSGDLEIVRAFELLPIN